MKSAIMVYCNNCKKKIELNKMPTKTLELELIDVLYCDHVNLNNRIYYPTWKTINTSEVKCKT